MNMGWGTCCHCEKEWNIVRPGPTIPTPIRGSSTVGIFPLCVNCWKITTKEEKIVALRELERQWSVNGYTSPEEEMLCKMKIHIAIDYVKRKC
jgi:hypothetical protein